MRQSAGHTPPRDTGSAWRLLRTASSRTCGHRQVSCHRPVIDVSLVRKGGKGFRAWLVLEGPVVRGAAAWLAAAGLRSPSCRNPVCLFLWSNHPCRHPLGFVRSEPDGGADQGRVPRREAAGTRRSRNAARSLRRAFGPAFPADLPFSPGSPRTLIRSASPVLFDRTRGDAGRAGRFRGLANSRRILRHDDEHALRKTS